MKIANEKRAELSVLRGIERGHYYTEHAMINFIPMSP